MPDYSKYTEKELNTAYNQLTNLIAVRAGMSEKICEVNQNAYDLLITEIQKRGLNENTNARN
jgi:hypothetical protein